MEAQVFLSHSSEDRDIAARICAQLEARGIKCWVAPRDVAPGADFGEQIIEAIEGTRATVLILSDGANQSVFVKNEIERAITKGKPVIPFRISDVQPSRALELFISRSQWIDALVPPLDARVEVLANALEGLVGGPLPHQTPHPAVAPKVSVVARRQVGMGAALAAIAVIVVLVAGLAGVAAVAGVLKPFGGTAHTTMTLSATQRNGQLATTVHAGDHVVIRASGTWCNGVSAQTGMPICGSAEGIYPASALEPVLVQSSRFGTLVGQIGDGKWFAVGSSFDRVVDESGEFRLAFNERTDGDQWWADNSGSITVNVTVS